MKPNKYDIFVVFFHLSIFSVNFFSILAVVCYCISIIISLHSTFIHSVDKSKVSCSSIFCTSFSFIVQFCLLECLFLSSLNDIILHTTNNWFNFLSSFSLSLQLYVVEKSQYQPMPELSEALKATKIEGEQ